MPHNIPSNPAPQLPLTRIATSAIHGNGVFACQPLRQGQVIEQCPCIVLEDGWQHVQTVLHDYLYCWPFDGDGRAIVLGNGSLFNHDTKPNAQWTTHIPSGTCIYTACRDIDKDEEIFIDYGPDYWTTHHASASKHQRIDLNLLLKNHSPDLVANRLADRDQSADRPADQ